MQYFKTELSIPPVLQAVVQAAERTRSYRRTVRYGYARLGRPVQDAAAPAPMLIALPRVQAVVDAMIELQAA
jgi:hypothetical protein